MCVLSVLIVCLAYLEFALTSCLVATICAGDAGLLGPTVSGHPKVVYCTGETLHRARPLPLFNFVNLLGSWYILC